MLTDVLVKLIMDFHDEHDTVSKRKRVNRIIERGYKEWMRDMGCFSYFSPADEYTAKCVVFRDYYMWLLFLKYFVRDLK